MPNPAHDRCHCGNDELWLGLDELITVVDEVLAHRLGQGDARMPPEARDRIRGRIVAGRRDGQAPDPARM